MVTTIIIVTRQKHQLEQKKSQDSLNITIQEQYFNISSYKYDLRLTFLLNPKDLDKKDKLIRGTIKHHKELGKVSQYN